MKRISPLLILLCILAIFVSPLARGQSHANEQSSARSDNGEGRPGKYSSKHFGKTNRTAAGNASDVRKMGGEGKHHKQHQNQAQGKGKGGTPTASPNSLRANPAVLSDRRMKTNISFVGRSPLGIPIYQFSYIGEPNKRYRGTIAQDVARIRPDAVVWRNGLMFVDYSRLDVRMEELPEVSGPEENHDCP